jgi:hypothetical protein
MCWISKRSPEQRTMMIQVRRCSGISCLRPFRVHKYKTLFAHGKRALLGTIVCPYCGETVESDLRYLYESHPVSQHEESLYEKLGSLPQREE